MILLLKKSLAYSNLRFKNDLFKRLIQNVLSLSILGIHVAQSPRTLL